MGIHVRIFDRLDRQFIAVAYFKLVYRGNPRPGLHSFFIRKDFIRIWTLKFAKF